jgi:hypothetical protein
VLQVVLVSYRGLVGWANPVELYLGQPLEVVVPTVDAEPPLVVQQLVGCFELQLAIETRIILMDVLLVHI